MLYREVGQFKTSYAQDMGIFPIRQDRIALYVVLAIAFIGVPILDIYQIWPFKGEYLLRAILIPFLILSLAAIGRKLGVSRERARQLEARAKKKLRDWLGDFAPANDVPAEAA